MNIDIMKPWKVIKCIFFNEPMNNLTTNATPFNTDLIDLVSNTNNDDGEEVDDFSRPFYLNMSMFIFGFLIAFVNGSLLCKMRRQRGFLKAKRYTFLANMTFCDFFSGIMLIALAIANVLGGDGPLVCILQGETCLNLCLTMSCYTCSIIVQFIAVRYPLYYKTNVTRAKVYAVVAMCWFYAIAYSSIKLSYVLAATHHAPEVRTYSVFPYIDVVVKSIYALGNCLFFAYVVVIATIRRRQQDAALFANTRPSLRSSIKEDTKDDDDADEDNNEISGSKYERTPFRRKTSAMINHYEAILTSGLRLLVYLATCLPLTVFCAYVLATNQTSALNPGKVYGDSRDVGVTLILLWFCRAIIDPLITLIREKDMSGGRRGSEASSRRTTITSLQQKQYERERTRTNSFGHKSES